MAFPLVEGGDVRRLFAMIEANIIRAIPPMVGDDVDDCVCESPWPTSARLPTFAYGRRSTVDGRRGGGHSAVDSAFLRRFLTLLASPELTLRGLRRNFVGRAEGGSRRSASLRRTSARRTPRG
jgi:hypothetical protein